MTLKQLEDIVRPNFVWDHNSVHKDMLTIPSHWRVVEKIHHHNDLIGLITFIGCAHVLGFHEQDVYKYVDIKRTKWIGLYGKFKSALQEHHAEQFNSNLELDFGEMSVNKLIIRKTNMVLNRIKLEKVCENYTDLLDFYF